MVSLGYKYSEEVKKKKRKYDHDKVIGLVNEGHKMFEIAKIMNIKYGSVQNIVKKYFPDYKRDVSGSKNSNWKGGVVYDRGRKLIYCPDHPYPNKFSTHVYNYRLIMEKYLGRYLKPNEIVHHKNGDVTDDRIENLEVMTQGEHAREHKVGFRTREGYIKEKNCKRCNKKFKVEFKTRRRTMCSISCARIYSNEVKNGRYT